MAAAHSVALPQGAHLELRRKEAIATNAVREYRSAVQAMAMAHGFGVYSYDPATGVISEPEEPEPDQVEAHDG